MTNTSPTLSPDGAWLAFSSNKPQAPLLLTVLNTMSFDTDPSWDWS